MKNPKPFLTEQSKFSDVSRGKPKPHSLKGDELVKARLTQDTWRLEIVADDSSKIEKSLTLADKTALDFNALLELGKKHSVKFLKAMQCNNIAQPLGQGLWEGVPLRDVLALAGDVSNVRRIYYWGFHNNDPAQVFQSSIGYEQIMETPPWDLTPLVAYRLNGEPISLLRGGPVRL
ncbi:MAG: molybdopterin-dependent oxidoreductase, partial [Gemmataceae bacterium]